MFFIQNPPYTLLLIHLYETAAEIGTRKVICEHSTIGIVVTTDGSIGEIPRENYVEAEERVIHELKNIKKPFVVLLNTVSPAEESAKQLSAEKRFRRLNDDINLSLPQCNFRQIAKRNVSGGAVVSYYQGKN